MALPDLDDLIAETGTEHLLWGLTAEADSATRLLESAGVPSGSVHRSGSAVIDCDDLLLGLAAVGRGVAATVLTEAGFTATELDSRVT